LGRRRRTQAGSQLEGQADGQASRQLFCDHVLLTLLRVWFCPLSQCFAGPPASEIWYAVTPMLQLVYSLQALHLHPAVDSVLRKQLVLATFTAGAQP
jgi:hypothetical protein